MGLKPILLTLNNKQSLIDKEKNFETIWISTWVQKKEVVQISLKLPLSKESLQSINSQVSHYMEIS
jgi:hypothetical protein